MEKKKTLKVVLGIALGILILLALGVTIVERRQKSQPLEPASVFSGEAELPVAANEMVFLFYEDTNGNDRFDYQEKVFKKVSVAVRRPGETQAFVTVPAEANGLVKISNLGRGRYEIAWENHELEQPIKAGDFIYRPYYLPLLPSQWQTIELTEAGYKAKVGIKPYQPKSVLVIREGQSLKFYDPERAKLLGFSNLEETAIKRFYFSHDQVFYLDQDELRQFSWRDKVNRTVMERLGEVPEQDFWIRADGQAIAFIEDNDWYLIDQPSDYQGRITDGDNNVLEVAELKLADWSPGGQLLIQAKTNEAEAGIYLVEQDSQARFQAKKIKPGTVNYLSWLEDGSLFYTDSSASYFYDFSGNSLTKYVALANGAEAIVSPDKRYVAARLNGQTIVVDYPAVKASQVEKHYLLPFTGQLAFSQDQVLINQAKSCQPDLDCGEVIRVELQGNGVWEISQRVELLDIQAEEVLGEIKL